MLRVGFVYNQEKIIWKPSYYIEWLGMSWDTQAGTLKVHQKRIDKILQTISRIQLSLYLTVRKLHSFVGQIVSMGPVCGNLTRLMTRHPQVKIAQAFDEDTV